MLFTFNRLSRQVTRDCHDRPRMSVSMRRHVGGLGFPRIRVDAVGMPMDIHHDRATLTWHTVSWLVREVRPELLQFYS